MKLLDGKIVSTAIKAEIKEEVNKLLQKSKRVPHLVAILVGENGASKTYVQNKSKNCNEVGFKSTVINFENTITQDELIGKIKELNMDSLVDGILVQLPLPSHINEQVIVSAIDPAKDVDGFHPFNVGKLVLGNADLISATPLGIMLILEYYNIETAGKNTVVIGRSNIVGRPISILMNQSRDFGNSTVTICHSKTNNIKNICLQADIIIVALGVPNFLTEDMVKQGVVVIDVGITRVVDSTKPLGYSIIGDVAFDKVSPKCSFISPVPGGVGLMTIAALLKNTFKAYKNQNHFD